MKTRPRKTKPTTFEKWLSQFIWWQDPKGRWVIIKDNHMKN